MFTIFYIIKIGQYIFKRLSLKTSQLNLYQEVTEIMKNVNKYFNCRYIYYCSVESTFQ